MAKEKFCARLAQDPEAEAWDRLAWKHGCLFDTLKWTRLFEPRLRRVGLFDAGGNLRGGFCVYEQRVLGLRVLRDPPFTPHIGPFFEYRATNPAARTNEERDVMEAMAAWLDRQRAAVVSLGLALHAKDCLQFYWRGYKVVPHYTYRIELKHSEDELLNAMSDDRRKGIRKAQKDGLVVEDLADVSTLRSLVGETFTRQEKAFPRVAMNAILHAYPPGPSGFCLSAKNGGQPVAGVYVVHDSRTAYYLMGGYTNGAHHGAGALAMWHAILKAKSMGLEVFDFEGSVIPAIERYFRGFGGVLTPCFSVHKAWLPIEMVLKLKYRNRF